MLTLYSEIHSCDLFTHTSESKASVAAVGCVSVCCQQCGNAGRALVCTGVEKNQQDCDRIVCWCSQLLTCRQDQVESPRASLPKSGMQWLWLLNTTVCAVRTPRGYDEVF